MRKYFYNLIIVVIIIIILITAVSCITNSEIKTSISPNAEDILPFNIEDWKTCGLEPDSGWKDIDIKYGKGISGVSADGIGFMRFSESAEYDFGSAGISGVRAPNIELQRSLVMSIKKSHTVSGPRGIEIGTGFLEVEKLFGIDKLLHEHYEVKPDSYSFFSDEFDMHLLYIKCVSSEYWPSKTLTLRTPINANSMDVKYLQLIINFEEDKVTSINYSRIREASVKEVTITPKHKNSFKLTGNDAQYFVNLLIRTSVSNTIEKNMVPDSEYKVKIDFYSSAKANLDFIYDEYDRFCFIYEGKPDLVYAIDEQRTKTFIEILNEK